MFTLNNHVALWIEYEVISLRHWHNFKSKTVAKYYYK